MAKGHKKKKPMVMERTRKLSKTEQIMINEGMATRLDNGHLKITEFEPTAKLEKHMKQVRAINENANELKQLKLQARRQRSLEKKALRRERLLLQQEEYNMLKNAA